MRSFAVLDRLLETVVPRRSLRLALRLLGIAALLKGLDLFLDLPSRLVAAGETPSLGWILPPPPAAAPLVSGIWVVAAALLCFGLVSRSSAATLALLGLWLTTSSARLYGNHLYLLALLCLLASFADMGSDQRSEREMVAAWPARLMQVQLSLVYGFGALAKMNSSFLSGQVLAATARAPSWLEQPLLSIPASIATVAIEGFLAVALWSHVLRPYAWGLGIALHVGILLVLPFELDLIVFAVACLALYPLFDVAGRPGAMEPAEPRHTESLPA